MRSYSYNEFVKDVRDLAKKMPKDYEAIVAVARGGLTIAHFLAEALEIKEVYTIGAKSYENRTKQGKPLIGQAPTVLAKKILVVDDIVDSGETMERVLKALRHKNSEAKIDTAALFYKPGASFKPDFWVQNASEWIEFFWSEDIG